MTTKLRTRKRRNNFVINYSPLEISGRKDKGLGNVFSVNVPSSKREWRGRQETVSEGHRKRKGDYVEGGPFNTVSTYVEIPTIEVELDTRQSSAFDGSNFNRRMEGPIHTPMPDAPQDGLGITFPLLDFGDLDTLGAEAVSIVHPGNPNADTGVALGEIARDGLPIPGIQAWKRRTEIAKAAGSEYLNAVFGWLPLVDSIKDTVQSIQDGNMILQNYHDASGGSVHREFQFPTIETESESTLGSSVSAVYSTTSGAFDLSGAERGPLTRTTKTIIRRWFSGSFTYHADKGSTPAARMLGYGSDAEKLFGTSLTPEVMWELTPWSWAIDWFSNAGSVINNLSNELFSGSVMRYGYIMEEKTVINTYYLPSGAGLAGYTGPVPPAQVIYVTKKRREANPFGFGLTWDELSPGQLLIAAALGITRLR